MLEFISLTIIVQTKCAVKGRRWFKLTNIFTFIQGQLTVTKLVSKKYSYILFFGGYTYIFQMLYTLKKFFFVCLICPGSKKVS